jgi:hypothetical protein
MKSATDAAVDVLGRPLEVDQEVVYNQSGAIAVGRITHISVHKLIGGGYGRRSTIVKIAKSFGGGVDNQCGKRATSSTVCNTDGIMILPLP